MTVGHGIPTIPGAGRLSIMVVGITIMITVGFGFLMMNGVLPGCRGEVLPGTMAGRL